MLRNILISGLIVLISAAAVLADAKQDVLAAAKKLADGENYGWTTKSEGAGGIGSGGSEGKTQKDGLTMLVLALRDGTAEVLFKGDKGAFRLPDEPWQSIADAADQRGPARMIAGMIQSYQPPAAQATNLASKAQDLQKAPDGGWTSALSAEDAAGLLQRRVGRRQGADGAGPPPVKDAKATVTFWTNGGVLTKFQFNVQGTMTIQGEDRQIDRTTTVEIKDVGTTKIEVPAEAKEKME